MPKLIAAPVPTPKVDLVNTVCRDVSLLHPVVIKNVEAILAQCAKEGLKVGVFETFRHIERQKMLVATNKSKTMNSYHCLGLAVDIVFKDAKGAWTWEAPKKSWDRLASIFQANGMFSLWANYGWDGPHCELHVPGSSSAALHTLLKSCKTTQEFYAQVTKQLVAKKK